MVHLRAEADAAAQHARARGPQTDGNHLVGGRGEVLSRVGHAAAHVAVEAHGAVEAQLAVVAGGLAGLQVADAERAQRLVILRVGSLHTVLQRVGQPVVFAEEGLAYLGNPRVRVAVDGEIHGLAAPESNVVQVYHVVVGPAVDDGSELAVANGQRLFKACGRAVVPQVQGLVSGLGGQWGGRQEEKERQAVDSFHFVAFT